MGSQTSKAMLLGVVEPVRIEAVLKAAGYDPGEARAISGAGSYTYSVKGPDGAHFGSFWLFGSEDNKHDHRDVYDGERTVVHGNTKFDDLLLALVEEFGGFLRADGDEGQWEYVEGRSRVELGPRENLLLLLQRVVPVEASHKLVAAFESDHGFGLDLVKAIEELPKPEAAYAPKA